MLKTMRRLQLLGYWGLMTYCPSLMSASASPLNYEFYDVFPRIGDVYSRPTPPGLEQGTYQALQHFDMYLKRMREAQDRLRSDCIGPYPIKMTAVVRGSNVLIYPEQYSKCDGYVKLLKDGDSGYDLAFVNINKAFKTKYPPPRGDAADIRAWRQRKLGIVSFNKPDCNEASRAIVLYGTALFSEPPDSIFARMKSKCPKNWVALFGPDSDLGKSGKSDKVCNPERIYIVSDERGVRESCDENDKISTKELESRRKEKKGLEAELDALAGGSYKGKGESGERSEEVHKLIQVRRKTNDQLVSDLETGIRNAPKAGEIGGLAIIGGETGKLLEQGARAIEGAGGLQGSGCNDEQERQATIRMQEPRAAQIQKLPQHQQACPVARLNVDIYQRALGYAERCNRRDTIPAIKGELNFNQTMVRQECDGAQTVSGSASSSGPNGGDSSRNSGGDRRCLQWRGSVSDPSCVSWSR